MVSFVDDAKGAKKLAAFAKTQFKRHFAAGAWSELCGNGALQAERFERIFVHQQVIVFLLTCYATEFRLPILSIFD